MGRNEEELACSAMVSNEVDFSDEHKGLNPCVEAFRKEESLMHLDGSLWLTSFWVVVNCEKEHWWHEIMAAIDEKLEQF